MDKLLDLEKRFLAGEFNQAEWNSIHIDYHPPIVDRVWLQVGSDRLSIHMIHPCEPEEALLHPHPWPGAFRVFGNYEMGVGFSDTLEPPKTGFKMNTGWGTCYEMVDKNVWHYVRPIGEPIPTIMVTGEPWGREIPVEPTGEFKSLSDAEKVDLLGYLQACLVTLRDQHSPGIGSHLRGVQWKILR